MYIQEATCSFFLMAYLICGHCAFATLIMNSQANPAMPFIGLGQEYNYVT